MDIRTLDFEKDKTQTISLPELKLSCSEAQSSGRPLHGIEHFQIYEAIQEVLDKKNVANTPMPLYISDGGDRALPGVARIPILEEKYGNKSLPATILRRVIGGISLTDFQDDESHGMIAVNFHQKGIKIAYGQNVRVCSNLSILGAGNSMSTYTNGLSEVMPSFQKMLEVIATWAEEHGQKRNYDVAVMNQMKQITMAHEKVAEVLGFMTMLRIGRDKYRTERAYPLSASQINQVAEKYLGIKEDERPISLWRFYNHITENHKAGMTDLPLIIDNNIATSQFLINHFELGGETYAEIVN